MFEEKINTKSASYKSPRKTKRNTRIMQPIVQVRGEAKFFHALNAVNGLRNMPGMYPPDTFVVELVDYDVVAINLTRRLPTRELKLVVELLMRDLKNHDVEANNLYLGYENMRAEQREWERQHREARAYATEKPHSVVAVPVKAIANSKPKG